MRIEVGEYSLRKHYTGQKGFPLFLDDFQDGRRIFKISEPAFADFRLQLANEGVQAIDVNYEIEGQKPVIQMLESVPEPPNNAISCWVR